MRTFTDKEQQMIDNLFWRLRDWMLHNTGYRCVTVSEMLDKIYKYAPKTIKRDREMFEAVAHDLWAVDSDCGILDDEMYLEDWNWWFDLNSKCFV